MQLKWLQALEKKLSIDTLCFDPWSGYKYLTQSFKIHRHISHFDWRLYISKMCVRVFVSL